METMLKRLLSDKGTKSYRTALLIVSLYVADKVTDLDKRVAVLESRARVTHHAVTTPGTVTGAASPKVTIGPEWPKSAAAAFRREN